MSHILRSSKKLSESVRPTIRSGRNARHQQLEIQDIVYGIVGLTVTIEYPCVE